MKTSERKILLGLAEMWERNSKAESQDGPVTGNSKNMVRLLAQQLRDVVGEFQVFDPDVPLKEQFPGIAGTSR